MNAFSPTSPVDSRPPIGAYSNEFPSLDIPTSFVFHFLSQGSHLPVGLQPFFPSDGLSPCKSREQFCRTYTRRVFLSIFPPLDRGPLPFSFPNFASSRILRFLRRNGRKMDLLLFSLLHRSSTPLVPPLLLLRGLVHFQNSPRVVTRSDWTRTF